MLGAVAGTHQAWLRCRGASLPAAAGQKGDGQRHQQGKHSFHRVSTFLGEILPVSAIQLLPQLRAEGGQRAHILLRHQPAEIGVAAEGLGGKVLKGPVHQRVLLRTGGDAEGTGRLAAAQLA